jgi:hypothetical protein
VVSRLHRRSSTDIGSSGGRGPGMAVMLVGAAAEKGARHAGPLTIGDSHLRASGANRREPFDNAPYLPYMWATLKIPASRRWCAAHLVGSHLETRRPDGAARRVRSSHRCWD